MIDLSKEINSILKDYADDVEKTLLKVEDEVAEEAIDKLKKTSPQKTRGKKKGHYAKSWKVDKKAKQRYAQTIIHNKDYQLTHLLENGHDIVRNGQVVGHAAAQPHIKPVEEWVKKEMVERTEKEL
ncbi:MAG: HK97 gp10 family phage protein [Lachnospiraceae bacterium]|nr:HK97 gp10 family phage protein [Lachnospiraceae bacterium]